MTILDDQADKASALVDRARLLFAGQEPVVQGAALADLLALWLTCHSAGKDTKALREHMLAAHIDVVRELIPMHEKEIFLRVVKALIE